MSSLLENHLPLSSNSSDIKASHYILCMQPDFDTKTISAKLFILCTLPIACEPMEQPGLLPKRLADSVEDNMAHGVLDMNNISIKSISLVLCDEKDLLSYWNPAIVRNNPVLTKHFFASGRNYIEFEETTWFIHFKCPRKSPFLICIEYVTSNAGVSISWREDEQGNPCFFTCGSAINNRSLLPYQDTPSALATWEAFVVVEDKYSVSMSSDGSAVDIPIDTDLLRLFNTEPFSNNFMSNCKDTKPKKCLYFYCSLSLPLATMAIAVGVWSVETLNCAKISQKEAERKMLPNCYPEDITESCLHGGTHAFNSEFVNNKDTSHPMKLPVPGLDINDVLHNNELQSSVPVSGKRSSESTSKPSGSVGNLPSSLVYPTSLSHRLEPLRQFLPHCLAAAEELLGPHPCPRLEIVVLPQSYASLGLASPNLIFLAQCIATAADSSMFLRIAHEISHAWFGIIIGAEDWTEEWLSEGFATMAEELIYEKAYRSFQISLLSGNRMLEQCDENLAFTGETCKTLSQITHSRLHEEPTCNSNFPFEKGRSESNAIIHLRDKVTMSDSNSTASFNNFELILSDSHVHKRLKIQNSAGEDIRLTRPNLDSSSWKNTIASCSADTILELKEIRIYLRYRKLVQEIEVSEESLQTLQPNAGGSVESTNYVLNGLQRDKPFLNVHYLKGFFLLRNLCDKVGDSNFKIFIKNYVSKFSGHLVTSDKFADHFFSFFPNISESKSKLLSDWLQKPGINDELKQTFGQFENPLSKAHCEFWLNFNRKPKTIKNHQSIPELEQLVYPEHLQLFCEYLLETEQRLCKTTMLSIDQTYNLSHQNCEVCHAWCELIIKHDHRPGAACVKKFLVEAQAMGIYLYGELMISGTKFWQNLARSTYASLKDSMEENTRLNIEEMLYPQ